MNVAFIVTLDIEMVDLDSLTNTALDIQDALEIEGQPVVSVAPWTRNSLQQPSLSDVASVLPAPIRSTTNPITPIEPL